MVIWSGKGFIVAILVFGCSLFTEMVTEKLTENDAFYQESSWALPLALIMAGALTAIIDVSLIPSHERNRHTLFFIPMIWWSIILPLAGLGIFIWSALNTPAEPIPLMQAPQ